MAGLEQRLSHLFPDQTVRAAKRPEYEQRLAFEIDTIVKMGFPGYFLIVADFIGWARAHGCPVGPGRGSGAGSLVAYALGITNVDPIPYKLLFERFLNPERVSMPDFDIDFCQANRERVIDYVKAKYGRDAVSQIATFGTMAAKAALRDVGRVLGMGYGHVDQIAKLIPAPPGKTVTLAKVPADYDPEKDSTIYARREAPELEQREAADEEVAELLALAVRVEGIVRNVGMHAGGVLIAPGKITDFCPLYQQPGSDSAVSQYDKDDVEAIGLVKFDFLGLATLTILEQAKVFIEARHPELAPFDYDALPLDDPAVYKLFSDGRTEAVFQFESRGMQGMLRDARPSRIEDLFALNAMFRPGPMENIPSFCARKHGREDIAYPHPSLGTVLGETYGIFVYQEQVMQAAQIMGGYSLGGADLLRRAMGKKKAEEMAQQRQIFRDGAAKNSIDQRKADEVFDLMEKFAGYGFNKSHAAAYSLLAYHTAWVKVHHPAAFYAANMTVEMDDADKLRALTTDAKSFGVAFDAPDVNAGGYAFEPVGDTRVRWGLGAIKGTGQGAIEAIVAARVGNDPQPYKSIFDFCRRIDRQRVNKRVVEALVKAGAFDALHAERTDTLASVGLAFEWADAQVVNADQGGLFDFADSDAASTTEPRLMSGPEWSIRERLTLEKSALGLYMSGHLFDQVEPEVRQFISRGLADVIESREPQWLAGVVSDLRFVNGQRGRVAIFKLDDKTDALECVADERVFTASAEALRDDQIVIIQARVQPDRFGGGGLRVNVQRCLDMAAARAEFGRYVAIAVNGVSPPVRDVLTKWPGRRDPNDEAARPRGLQLRLLFERKAVSAEIDLGAQATFWPSDEALAVFRQHAQGGRASVVYAEHRGALDAGMTPGMMSGTTALVLTGGGARAAYQVGVLKGLARLRREAHARRGNPFHVIVGTSAGAINAAALASHADQFDLAVAKIADTWKNLHTDRVYRADSFGVINTGAKWLTMLTAGWAFKRWRKAKARSLLDNTPLRGLLDELVHLPAAARGDARGASAVARDHRVELRQRRPRHLLRIGRRRRAVVAPAPTLGARAHRQRPPDGVVGDPLRVPGDAGSVRRPHRVVRRRVDAPVGADLAGCAPRGAARAGGWCGPHARAHGPAPRGRRSARTWRRSAAMRWRASFSTAWRPTSSA